MPRDATVRVLGLCLALGFALRVVLAWLVLTDTSVLMAADQKTYLELADVLRAGLDFGPAFGTERVPAYPVFLALVQALTGTTFVGPVIVQNLLGGLTVWACWKLGRLFDERTANLCAAMAALNMNMAVYANQMLTESLFMPLFAWALYWLCAHAVLGRTRDLILFSLACGFGLLVRPVGQYLPLFMVPWLVMRPGGGALRARLGQAALFLVLLAVCAAPWVARNVAVYGHAGLTTQGKAHLPGWIVPSVARFEEGIDQASAVQKYTNMWREHLASMPDAVRGNPFACTDEAKRFAADYLSSVSPVSVAKAWLFGAARNLLVPVTVELAYILDLQWTHFADTAGSGMLEQIWNFLAGNENMVFVVMLVGGLVMMAILRLVQLWGAVDLWRRSRAVFLVLAMMTVYFLAVSGPVGYAKYRLPYEPVFVLCTALWLARLPWFRQRDTEGGRA